MPKLSEIDTGPKKIILYGEVGCGKTALALTLGEKALYADFDQGLQTGATLKDKFTADRNQAEIVTFYDTNPDSVTTYSRFKQFVIKLCNDCKAGRVPQKVLVIDSLTAMIESAMNNVLSNSNHLGCNPTQPEWGMAFTEVTNVMRILKATNIHFICLAHVFSYSERVGQSEVQKRKIYIQGNKLEPKIMPFFDEIWYMQVRGKKRSIKTLNNGNLLARSRSHIPEEIDLTDISMVELFKQLSVEL